MSKTQSPLKGKLILLSIKLLAKLPLSVGLAISWLIGKIRTRLPTKEKTVIDKNLQLCLPDLSQQQREQLRNQTIMQSAKLITELPVAWCGSKNKINNRILKVHHAELLKPYLNSQKSVVLAFPHLGNWEFFWHWMQINYPAFGIYRSAKIRELDKLLATAREKFGGRAFPGDSKGLASIIRTLKQGGIMGILPDQAPKAGAGIYAPFFGVPAYTMTLLHKLIQKTHADLIMGSCLRDASGKGFNIHLYAPTFDIKTDDVNHFNLGMNKQLESIIMQAPEQYQWSYKRFKRNMQGRNYYA